MPTISGVIESTLYVKDVSKSVEFYERVLGFRTLFASERITALRVAPRQVLLIAKQGASAEPSEWGGVPLHDATGQQHVAFGVRPDQLGEWRSTLERHGLDIERVIEWPEGGESLYFRDPDHHSLELKTSDWDGKPLPSPGPSESS